MHFENQGANSLLTDNVAPRNRKRSRSDIVLWIGIGLLALIGVLYSTNLAQNIGSIPFASHRADFSIGETYNFYVSDSSNSKWTADNLRLRVVSPESYPQELELSEFTVVSGLAGKNSISLRSAAYPTYFVYRELSGQLVLKAKTAANDYKFDRRASFYFDQEQSGSVSFESVSHPGYYIINKGSQLITEQILNQKSSNSLFRFEPVNTLKISPATPVTSGLTMHTLIFENSTIPAENIKIGDIIRFQHYKARNEHVLEPNYEFNLVMSEDFGDKEALDKDSFEVIQCIDGSNAYSFRNIYWDTYHIYYDDNKYLIIGEVPSDQLSRACFLFKSGHVATYYRIESTGAAGYYFNYDRNWARLMGDNQEDTVNWWLIDSVSRSNCSLKAGDFIKFQTYRFPDEYVQVVGEKHLMESDSNWQNRAAYDAETTFKVHLGLDGKDTYSFESMLYPGEFIAPFGAANECHTRSVDTSNATDAQQASWKVYPSVFTGFHYVENSFIEREFFRHASNHLQVMHNEGDTYFEKDTSWGLEPTDWQEEESIGPNFGDTTTDTTTDTDTGSVSDPPATDPVDPNAGQVVVVPPEKDHFTLPYNSWIRFESYNFPNDYLTHEDFIIKKLGDNGDVTRFQSMTWKILPGLTGDANTYSFESLNFPGYYMTHSGIDVLMQQVTEADKPRATWYILDGDYPRTIKLEPFDVADNFIVHRDHIAYIGASDGTDNFNQHANWIPEIEYPTVQWTPGYYRIQSFNFPGDYISHSSFEAWKYTDDFTDNFLVHSTWYVHAPGLAGDVDCVSFESVNYPGYFLTREGEFINMRAAPGASAASFYIHESDSPNYFTIEMHDWQFRYARHQDHRIKAQTKKGSDSENPDFKWMILPSTYDPSDYLPQSDVVLPEGYFLTIESYNFPNYFLRHRDFQIWMDPFEAGPGFEVHMTWKAVPGLSGDPRSYSFESQNYPGYYLAHVNGNIDMLNNPAGRERAFTWAVQRSSFPGYYYLESLEKPDNFITHGNYRAILTPYENTDGYEIHRSWKLKYMPDENHDPAAPLTLGSPMKLQAENFPNDYYRHSNLDVWLHPNDKTLNFDLDSNWIVRDGLAGFGSYSFEAEDKPGYYLMHDGTLVYIKAVTSAQYPQASWFARDSKDPYIKLQSFDWIGQFIAHSGSRAQLAANDGTSTWDSNSNINVLPDTLEPEPDNSQAIPYGQTAQFESGNFPGHFMRHQNYEVWKHLHDGSKAFDLDSSFIAVAGLSGTNSVSFQSVNYPTYYLYHDNNLIYIRTVSPGKEVKASWFVRPNGAGDMLKIESVDQAGYYMRHDGNRVKLHPDDGTSQFDGDSNWKPNYVQYSDDDTDVDYTHQVVIGGRFGIESFDLPDHYWQHVNFAGQLQPNTNDPIVNQNFLFDVVEGLSGAGTISFRSVNYPDRFLTKNHNNLLLESGSTQQFRDDASFRVQNGLYGANGVSFESLSSPDHYIVHSNYQLMVKPYDGSQSFGKAATWFADSQPTQDLAPAYPIDTGSTIHLRPHNNQNGFLIDKNGEVWIGSDDGSDSFYDTSSFVVEHGLAGVGTISFRSVNHPTYFIYHDGLYLYVGVIASGREGSASFYPRQSTGGDYARFESFDKPEYFIGENNGRAVLLLNDGSSHINDLTSWKVDTVDEQVDPYDQYLTIGGTYAFLSSTNSNSYWHSSSFVIQETHFNGDLNSNTEYQFEVVDGLAGPGTISFRSVKYPDRYIRHSSFKLWLHQGSGSAFANDASYYMRAGLSGVGGISFESVDLPNHYIRVDAGTLVISTMDCCTDFRADATFYPIQISVSGGSVITDEVFYASLTSALRVSVTQETLTTEMVANANEMILLKLVTYDETINNEQIFQQTGGNIVLVNDFDMDITLPYYNFEKGQLEFYDNEVVNVQFGHEILSPQRFHDVVQLQFDPMAFYRVSVFVTRVFVEVSFTAEAASGNWVEGTYTMVQYAQPTVQINMIGSASMNIEINAITEAHGCTNCD